MPFLTAASQRLEYRRIGIARAGRPTLVFLHEGLGSVSMWRGFPARVAGATGCSAIVFSRRGYGKSEPLTGPRTVRYMHDEAERVLPELIERLAVDRPILIGHSDGGSIALIYAATAPSPPLGVVTLAAHVFVEDISVASIADARKKYVTTDLPKRLARHHADADSAFRGWNDIWLAPEFRSWNIEEYLPRIACPLLAIQGEDDEYGTREQMRRIGAQVPDDELVMLPDCGHSAHRDQPDAVIDAIARFVERVGARQ
jgi:pimeloyl-ACP methyl ester carboxylesterase